MNIGTRDRGCVVRDLIFRVVEREDGRVRGARGHELVEQRVVLPDDVHQREVDRVRRGVTQPHGGADNTAIVPGPPVKIPAA